MPWSPWVTWPRAQAIDLASHPGVMVVTIKRPAKRNALKMPLALELGIDAAAFERLREAGLV